MKRAIIDIGTNTAHMLIGVVSGGMLEKVLYKKRHYTFLGDGGLEEVSQAALDRLWTALDDFSKSLSEHRCTSVHIVATEGLRSASNSTEIEERIVGHYGWPLSIISGIEESRLILEGVRQSKDLSRGNFLIMDVGGGSVEFIQCIDGEVLTQDSYPIGISRLYEKFHKSDPFKKSDARRMASYLDKVLKGFWDNIGSRNGQPELIGCAGTFEIFLDSRVKHDPNQAISTTSRDHLRELLRQVKEKDLHKRTLVPGIPANRAKYIVVALLLIEYVLDKLGGESFWVSKYALKEGAIIDHDNYF